MNVLVSNFLKLTAAREKFSKQPALHRRLATRSVSRSTTGEMQRAIRMLHTSIVVSDLEQSVEFYCEVLGLREIQSLVYAEDRFSLVYLGAGQGYSAVDLELVHRWDGIAPEREMSRAALSFEVVDLEKLVKQAVDAGAQIVADVSRFQPTELRGFPAKKFAILGDPDGNMVEVVEQRRSHRHPTHFL